MSEMLDRLEKIIEDTYEITTSYDLVDPRGMAQSVLLVLREPTDDMLKVGQPGIGAEEVTKAGWQDMIDAALNDQTHD